MLAGVESTANQKVGKSDQKGHVIGMFMKATIARPGIAKDLLDITKWVFYHR
jgi:hypothetical protein